MIPPVSQFKRFDVCNVIRRGCKPFAEIRQRTVKLDLTLKDVETRLANWLIKRCPNPRNERPATINLPMTKRVLAAELGTVSETFSRTLAKFRQQNLLAVKGKSIVVLSPARLEMLLRRNLGE